MGKLKRSASRSSVSVCDKTSKGQTGSEDLEAQPPKKRNKKIAQEPSSASAGPTKGQEGGA
eukprot:CAMPEP_0180785530 /NCGR_PEP_ID=MMETSP1038_2-20121128/50259_1 /TAXON_ID=632150 /ORGANISM="Azadinium spinosum, Strain 3D9" /LENGTH=60 /DNA_ID=CAMNT_0022822477 /DNA_START=44 /DNA_END=222 /DNA_ORIENTATION=+